MNGFDQQRDNDVRGLAWVHQFGWIRPLELGRIMWPNDATSRNRTYRVVRGWLARNLVVERKLPGKAGLCVVLARAGVRLLVNAKRAAEIRVTWRTDATPVNDWQHELLAKLDPVSAVDWGSGTGETWKPSLTWQHDLIAAGVLTVLFERGFQIMPEKQIRRENAGLVKIPDGLAWQKAGIVYWLEVEQARKTGAGQRALADALCAVTESNSRVTVSGMVPTEALVAFAAGGQDDRGMQINHVARVTAGLQQMAPRDIKITWAECTMLGCSVDDLTLKPALIQSDRATRILNVLNSGGWKLASDGEYNGCYVANYGNTLAIIWDGNEYGWCYQIAPGTAYPGQTNSLAAAKRGCAERLAAQQ